MSETAEVIAEVEYDGPEQGQRGTSRTTDKVDSTTGATLEAKSDDSGTSTRREVPNSDGGTTERKRNRPLPAGVTIDKARVTIKRSCGTSPDIELTGEGNNSAQAYIEGQCIVVKTVDKKQMLNGGTELVTTTKRKCCGKGGKVSRLEQDSIEERTKERMEEQMEQRTHC